MTTFLRVRVIANKQARNPAISAKKFQTFGKPGAHGTLIPNCTWRAVVEALVIARRVPETPVGFAVVGGVKLIRLGVLADSSPLSTVAAAARPLGRTNPDGEKR
jgi:hypothetical protein